MQKKKKTSVLHLNLNPNSRFLFISDIHADKELFKMALDKADFKDDDVLFIIGDVIEKGENNLELLDYLLELKEKYQIYFLAGNCDEVLRYIIPPVDKDNFLYYAIVKGNSIVNEMANKLNIKLDYDMDVDNVCEKFHKEFIKYYNFIDEFYDVIILNDKYVLVHGGLDDVSNIPEYNNSLLKYDSFYLKAKYSPYIRIVGHFPVVNYTTSIPCNNPIFDFNRNVISIDGGNKVKLSGQLNILILENEKFSYFYVDKYPKQICKKNIILPLSKPCHMDSYLGNVIYKGEKLGDFYVVYNEIGEKAYAYKTNVIIDKDKFFCYDATNYMMPLRKGDRYSIIIKAWPFTIVKKEGYIGLVSTRLVDADEV